MEKTNKEKFGLSLNFWLLAVTTLVTLFSLAANFVFAGRTSLVLNKKIAEAEEAARPAEINLIVLKDSSCNDCVSLEPLINSIKQANVKITEEKIIEAANPESKELISKYQIAKLPGLIVGGEIEKEQALKELWSKLGEIKEGVFILRQLGAPYVLVGTGEVKGRINLVMLMDKSCQNCYDVTVHESILRTYGLSTAEQKVVEASLGDGPKLIKQYKIELSPTIILSGDLDAYPALKSVWSSVGTVEKDGTYVFRAGVKNMGVYKDLTTGQIVDPRTKQQPQQQ